MRLGFETSTCGDWRVLSVTGEVDVATASSLREQLDLAQSKGATKIAVDLEGVEFMDSTGLSVLVSLARELGKASTAVVTTRTNLIKIIELTSLGEVMTVCASQDLLPSS